MTRSITVAELRRGARRVLDRMHRAGEPLVVTQRGRGRAVLVPFELYQRQQQEMECLRVLALVEAGRRAVAEGRTRSTREVRRAFQHRREKPCRERR